MTEALAEWEYAAVHKRQTSMAGWMNYRKQKVMTFIGRQLALEQPGGIIEQVDYRCVALSLSSQVLGGNR